MQSPKYKPVRQKLLYKLCWDYLSLNPNFMDVIRELDYEAMKKTMQPLAEELAQRINDPRKYGSQEAFLQRQIELGFLEREEIE